MTTRVLLFAILRSAVAQPNATPDYIVQMCHTDTKISDALIAFDAATAAERDAGFDSFCDLVEKGLTCCQWGECFDKINGTHTMMERRNECRRAMARGGGVFTVTAPEHKPFPHTSDGSLAATTGMPTAPARSVPTPESPAQQAANQTRTAPMMVTSGLVGLVPYGGVLLSNALYLSPMMSVRYAVNTGRLGSLNVVPQALMVVSTGAWLSYGFSLPNVFILASNLGGSVLSVYYVLATFHLIPPEQLSDRRAVQAILVVGNTAMLLLWTVLVLSELARRTVSFVLGAYGSFLCVLLFAAPLSTVRTVVASRSSASIQAPLLATQLANCVLWTVYGLIISDVWVWGPNMAGLTLAAIQLILKLKYPSAAYHGRVSNEDVEDVDVEMLWTPQSKHSLEEDLRV